MAESPNDKAMREKLQSASYPYDPAAWGEMEKMLDQKKKRRGIIWWSSLGAVASLLMGAGVYIAMHGDSFNSNTVAQLTKNELRTKQPISINNATPQDIQKSENTTQTPLALNKAYISHKNTSTNRHYEASSHSQNSSLPKTPLKHSTISYPQTASTVRSASMARPSYSISEIVLTPEFLHSVIYSCLEEDQGDPVQMIPAKLKKKIVISYKLGVEGDVYEGFAHKTFSDRPTWGVGISQELGIGKYFAITNSILFAEVNFKINNPKYPVNNYAALESYRSHVREVAIPIGIKVYPYSNKHLKIGIGVAYVNHIKLQETFDYRFNPLQINSVNSSDLPTAFPASNNFTNPGKNPTYIFANSAPPGNVIADYYSIGKGRRYYGSMMYTVGVEVALPRHFSISAEPCMMMSLDKIKMQNRRVLDIGMNTGVKYAF